MFSTWVDLWSAVLALVMLAGLLALTVLAAGLLFQWAWNVLANLFSIPQMELAHGIAAVIILSIVCGRGRVEIEREGGD